jgi:hypothetical protein
MMFYDLEWEWVCGFGAGNDLDLEIVNPYSVGDKTGVEREAVVAAVAESGDAIPFFGVMSLAMYGRRADGGEAFSSAAPAAIERGEVKLWFGQGCARYFVHRVFSRYPAVENTSTLYQGEELLAVGDAAVAELLAEHFGTLESAPMTTYARSDEYGSPRVPAMRQLEVIDAAFKTEETVRFPRVPAARRIEMFGAAFEIEETIRFLLAVDVLKQNNQFGASWSVDFEPGEPAAAADDAGLTLRLPPPAADGLLPPPELIVNDGF